MLSLNSPLVESLNYSIPILCAILLVSLLGLAVYRLHFDPLAPFPGPKLAALTRYYEFYFDAVRGGLYTTEIGRMHEKYGLSLSDFAWFCMPICREIG